MARVFDGPGGVTWRDWRDAKSEAGSQPTVGFIDGDLVERFLDIKDEETIESIMVVGPLTLTFAMCFLVADDLAINRAPTSTRRSFRRMLSYAVSSRGLGDYTRIGARVLLMSEDCCCTIFFAL
jgi:hypothetical protein